MGNVELCLMETVRCQILKTPLHIPAECELSDDFLKSLYRLSKKHDIAHLVGSALLDNHLITNGEIAAAFQKQILLAVFRYEQINREYIQLCRVLDDAKIPYLPLKGVVIRPLYPEPFMRTSSDIDILLHREDIERAEDALRMELKYTKEGNPSAHDTSLYSVSRVHVELHFDLIEQGRIGKAEILLCRIWDSATPEDGTYRYTLSDDMFYYYHIAHMAKHFANGGCGIRPFIDLWLLNHRMSFDQEKRDTLLEKGGLLAFARASEKLSDIWMSGAETDELSARMQSFILNGGVYGTVDNHVVTRQIKTGGRLRAIVTRVFLPYNLIILDYPNLSKHRCLMPYYQVKRWFSIVFSKKLRRGIHEIKATMAVKDENRKDIETMLKKLNLL